MNCFISSSLNYNPWKLCPVHLAANASEVRKMTAVTSVTGTITIVVTPAIAITARITIAPEGVTAANRFLIAVRRRNGGDHDQKRQSQDKRQSLHGCHFS